MANLCEKGYIPEEIRDNALREILTKVRLDAVHVETLLMGAPDSPAIEKPSLWKFQRGKRMKRRQYKARNSLGKCCQNAAAVGSIFCQHHQGEELESVEGFLSRLPMLEQSATVGTSSTAPAFCLLRDHEAFQQGQLPVPVKPLLDHNGNSFLLQHSGQNGFFLAFNRGDQIFATVGFYSEAQAVGLVEGFAKALGLTG